MSNQRSMSESDNAAAASALEIVDDGTGGQIDHARSEGGEVEFRAHISAHCRSTVADNDRIGAIGTVAAAIVLGLSFFLTLLGMNAPHAFTPLVIVGWGLLIGSMALFLGGRYAGRASARCHLNAQLARGRESHAASDEPDGTTESHRWEKSEQGFATTYDWLTGSGELLFVAGLVCIVVFAALAMSHLFTR